MESGAQRHNDFWSSCFTCLLTRPVNIAWTQNGSELHFPKKSLALYFPDKILRVLNSSGIPGQGGVLQGWIQGRYSQSRQDRSAGRHWWLAMVRFSDRCNDPGSLFTISPYMITSECLFGLPISSLLPYITAENFRSVCSHRRTAPRDFYNFTIHDTLGVFARFADQLPFTIHHGVAADELEFASSSQTNVMIQFASSIQTSVMTSAVCEKGEQWQLTLETSG
jgi:hypothetical protein